MQNTKYKNLKKLALVGRTTSQLAVYAAKDLREEIKVRGKGAGADADDPSSGSPRSASSVFGRRRRACGAATPSVALEALRMFQKTVAESAYFPPLTVLFCRLKPQAVGGGGLSGTTTARGIWRGMGARGSVVTPMRADATLPAPPPRADSAAAL